jgi:hypothetical protein
MATIRGLIVGQELRSGVRKPDGFDRLRFEEEGVKVQKWTACVWCRALVAQSERFRQRTKQQSGIGDA